MAYSHEKLGVYQEALIFTGWIANSIKPALKGHDSDLANQISRASQSIVLNIAEGGSRWMEGDQRRFYLFARGSGAECSAALDVIRVSNLYDISKPDWIENVDRIDKIGAWMQRLIESVEKAMGMTRRKSRTVEDTVSSGWSGRWGKRRG